jgi:hypothetical protein
MQGSVKQVLHCRTIPWIPGGGTAALLTDGAAIVGLAELIALEKLAARGRIKEICF